MTKIAIVDIETTGFQRDNGQIVEVGIVELDLSTGATRILYNALVKEPEFGEQHKNAWIFKNSDLTFEEVNQAEPLNTELIQDILNIYPATAYNKSFDFNFLKSRGIHASELDCPMLVATEVCKIPGPYGYKWASVQEAYDFLFPNTGFKEKHRGADDALHEAKIVHKLYEMGEFKVNATKRDTESN